MISRRYHSVLDISSPALSPPLDFGLFQFQDRRCGCLFGFALNLEGNSDNLTTATTTALPCFNDQDTELCQLVDFFQRRIQDASSGRVPENADR